MANYKNQTTIHIGALEQPLLHIKKEKGEETESFLLSLNWEPLLDVMSDLSAEEYMLWCYLLKWRGQGHYDFSPADLEDKLGWSDTSARKYRDGLVKKDYLTKVSNNTYNFNPFPEIVRYRAAKVREDNRKRREERESKKKKK